MKRILSALILTLLAALCVPTVQAAAPYTTKTVELKTGLYAKMETSEGDMIMELLYKRAPRTVQNFVELATGKKKWMKDGKWMEGKPLYDGTVFHRIIKGFMIQGGDPTGTGSGQVGFRIKMERSPGLNHDQRGRMAMARSSSVDSASSQFYITFGPAPNLDNPQSPYAVFGQLLHGMETLSHLEATPVKSSGRGEMSTPIDTPKLHKVSIIRVADGATEKVSYLVLNAPKGAAEAKN